MVEEKRQHVRQLKLTMFVFILSLMVAFLSTGCEMENSIIKEMEIAEKVANKQKNVTSKEEHIAISLVVQKHFPIGMKKKKALILINQLYEDGFEVLELKNEGTRVWPNVEFRHYSNVNREKHYPHGTVGYVIEKQYDIVNLIITRTAVISIKFDSSDTVISSEGRINTSSI